MARPKTSLVDVVLLLRAAPPGEHRFERVSQWATERGLKVTALSAVQRCVVVRGQKAKVQRLFGALQGTTLRVPPALAEVVSEAIGYGGPTAGSIRIRVPARWGTAVEPRHVAQYYRFPPALRGQGQTIGLILLGGGFHASDLEMYFRRLKLRLPTVVTVAADGQPNAPADKKYLAAYVRAMQTGKRPKLPSSGRNASANVQWTWETTQGIELVGAFANAAKVVVYFGQNSEAGRYRVLARAIRDEVQQASVLCCSWHIGFEEEVRREERTRLNALFREAGRRGVTICTASGDWGDGTQAPGAPKRNAARVCFPASSPHVLACGGSSQILEEKKGEETVWSEIVASMQIGSGGGVSRVFGLPLWQQDAAVISKTRRRGRGVPDVAAKADLEGGYFGILGGVEVRNGGTSAAAPLWASLIAILNQALGVRLGFVNPLLYHPKVRRSLRAVVLGQAGQRYHASRGWNPCTGLGTPIVVALLRSLRKHGLAKRGA